MSENVESWDGLAYVERILKPPSPKIWSLYVLRCKDGTLYCGIAIDVARRLDQHNRGQGARYTRGRGPVVLVHAWPAESRSMALKAEAAFKALARHSKEEILRKAESPGPGHREWPT